jgi:hypothetical protein
MDWYAAQSPLLAEKMTRTPFFLVGSVFCPLIFGWVWPVARRSRADGDETKKSLCTWGAKVFFYK